MKISTLSILITGIALFELYRTFSRLERDVIGIRSALVWVVMWLSISIFCLFPQWIDKIMYIAQMKDRMLFLFVISIFILYAIVFNINSRQDKISRDISKAMQEISLVRHEIEKDRSST